MSNIMTSPNYRAMSYEELDNIAIARAAAELPDDISQEDFDYAVARIKAELTAPPPPPEQLKMFSADGAANIYTPTELDDAADYDYPS